MKYSYKIHQDIYHDAWNWWNACNNIDFGVDWKTKIDPNLYKKIFGRNRKEAFEYLIPYLKQRYKRKNNFKKRKNFILAQFDFKFQKGCEKIVKIMGKPLYRTDYYFYLTTFERAPYNKEKGIVWLPVNWEDPIAVFLHELCHFQFIHYWRENSRSQVSKLSKEQFEFLKESLTIILDQDFFPMIKKTDKGYKIHQNFRNELTNFWLKEKDFNKLVEFGTKKITQYI